MEEKNEWVKRILGINGHDDEPDRRPISPGGFQSLNKAIATALVWCAATLLILRFRNPELGLLLGAGAVGATVFIWRKRPGI
ncbi:MAG: hypothetical protein HY401_05650 [Elusimicrobia bacterium]|nr:hypothetical protein [Elusimicrobiota bacterium]